VYKNVENSSRVKSLVSQSILLNKLTLMYCKDKISTLLSTGQNKDKLANMDSYKDFSID